MPTMVMLFVLLAGAHLSAAARSPEVTIATVQVSEQYKGPVSASHTGRGTVFSTSNVMLREAGSRRFQDPGDSTVGLTEKALRINDPGDSPVRIRSAAVKESAQRINDPGDSPIRISSAAVKESAQRINDPGDSPIRISSAAVKESAQRINDPGDSPVRFSSAAVKESAQRINDPGDSPVHVFSQNEAGQKVEGTVGGIYEDPSDFIPSRKLMQTAVFVDVTPKGSVDVLAPFTAVTVRKEAGSAGSSSSTRKLSQTIDAAGVHVDVTPKGSVAVNVATSLAADAVHKTWGLAVKARSLLDSSQLGAQLADDEQPEEVQSIIYNDESDDSSDDSSNDAAELQWEEFERPEVVSAEPDSPMEGTITDVSTSASSKPASTMPSNGYYTKRTGHSKSSSSRRGYYTKGATADAAEEDTSDAATSSASSTTDAGDSAELASDEASADDVSAANVNTAQVAVASISQPARVKVFHFATSDGEGTDKVPEGVQDAPLSTKVAAAAAAAALEESEAVAAADSTADAGDVGAAAVTKGQGAGAATVAAATESPQEEEEPQTAEPMFTKLTLEPTQLGDTEELPEGDVEEEELPLAAGTQASTDDELAVSAGVAAAAGITSNTKPMHLPGTAADAAMEEEEEEEDEDSDGEGQGAEHEGSGEKQPAAKLAGKAATNSAKLSSIAQHLVSVAATESVDPDYEVDAESEVSGDAAEENDAEVAGQGGTQVVAGEEEVAQTRGALDNGDDAEDAAPKTDALASLTSQPQSAELQQDAPHNPFFNVVSRPKSPLAGLFGGTKVAVAGPGTAVYRNRHKHPRKHAPKRKRKRAHAYGEMNPHVPYGGHSQHQYDAAELPTAAGLASRMPGGFVAAAAVPSSAAVSADSGIRPTAPFVYSVQEAGTRSSAAAVLTATQRLPGSSDDTPIEIVQSLARRLMRW